MGKTVATTERLAKALEALGDPKLAPMIQRAREGYYDDFKSPLATPITQLVNDLRAAGHHAMARRAREGEFDGTREEAEAWWLEEGQFLHRKATGGGDSERTH